MESHSNLKFASFNCRGFKSSEDYISHLFNDVDVLVIQEHWLLPTEFGLFSSISEDVQYCSVPPMEMDQLMPGRPYGGVALLWRKNLQHAIFPIASVFDRMVAVRLKTDRGNQLVVSVYMPVDYGDRESSENYDAEIGFLEGLLESDVYDGVVILGDFNADLDSKKGRFIRKVNSLLGRCELLAVGLDMFSRTGLHTWHSPDFSQRTWIDYVCVSQSLATAVTGFEIKEDGDITSDHWPVIVDFDLHVGSIKPKQSSPGKRLLWREAKERDLVNYRKYLELKLSIVCIPAEAVVCNNPRSCVHREQLQE